MRINDEDDDKECPDGLLPTSCFVDPCFGKTCAANLDAECRADYCGGCNFDFYHNGEKVQCDAMNIGGEMEIPTFLGGADFGEDTATDPAPLEPIILTDGDYPETTATTTGANDVTTPLSYEEEEVISTEAPRRKTTEKMNTEEMTTNTTPIPTTIESEEELLESTAQTPATGSPSSAVEVDNDDDDDDDATVDISDIEQGAAEETDMEKSDTKKQCPEICPAIYAPVCASDGKTYSNECAFKVAHCHDMNLELVHQGECTITDTVTQSKPAPLTVKTEAPDEEDLLKELESLDSGTEIPVIESGAAEMIEPLCESGHFSCDDACVPNAWKCDGTADCADGTDEDMCEAPEAAKCGAQQFKCNSGQCISSLFRCDGHADCRDGSDEHNCVARFIGQCCETGFRRAHHSGTGCTEPAPKIKGSNHTQMLCGNVYDRCCERGADHAKQEAKKTQCKKGVMLASMQLKATKTQGTMNECHKCCTAAWNDDGIPEGGSNLCTDAYMQCAKEREMANPCADEESPVCGYGQCVQKGRSYECTCSEGYMFDEDKKTCVDKDECEEKSDNCDKNAQCTNTLGSFSCACNDGYSGDGQTCQDVNECEQDTNPCDNNAKCSNTIGSFTCECLIGYIGDGKSCSDRNECMIYENICGRGACENTEGSYKCSCEKGFVFESGTTCVDIDECQQPGICGNEGSCNNTLGAYECHCSDGYKNAGETLASPCEDVDECMRDTNPCGQGTCTNKPGYYLCACNDGYVISEELGTCVDINECNMDTNPCGEGRGVCKNTEGSYECTCNNGHRFNEEEKTCRDINECLENENICGEGLGECMNTEGSYSCKCNSGARPTDDGRACTDINECKERENICGEGLGTCINIPGSYQCECSTGAEYDTEAMTCRDIDECAGEETMDVCGVAGKRCINTKLSYTCECQSGYEFKLNEGSMEQKGSCMDINECAAAGDLQEVCGAAATGCTNTDGSFKCQCNKGYRANDGEQCEDINECKENADICAGGKCMNTAGSYSCDCNEGLRFTEGTCKDIDECEQENICGDGGSCFNIHASYRCQCKTGYQQSEMGKQCKDVDECSVRDVCGAGGSCTNTKGSYSCSCTDGYRLKDGKCHDVDECKETSNICGNGDCENTMGDYKCICSPGYKTNSDGRCDDCEDMFEKNSEGKCVKVVIEGLVEPDTKTVVEKKCPIDCPGCNNPTAGKKCNCPRGWDEVNGKCIDMDECKQYPGICNQMPGTSCYNSIGAFECLKFECDDKDDTYADDKFLIKHKKDKGTCVRANKFRRKTPLRNIKYIPRTFYKTMAKGAEIFEWVPAFADVTATGRNAKQTKRKQAQTRKFINRFALQFKLIGKHLQSFTLENVVDSVTGHVYGVRLLSSRSMEGPLKFSGMRIILSIHKRRGKKRISKKPQAQFGREVELFLARYDFGKSKGWTMPKFG